MIHLIGVNHLVQYDHDHPATAKFKADVLEVIDALDISIVAEEFSDAAKKLWNVRESVLELVAKAKGREHRFCDPTPIEKKKYGIEESDNDKRRQFWLSRIQDCKSRNVLFVCGDEHIEAFTAMLNADGFDVKQGRRYQLSTAQIVRIKARKSRVRHQLHCSSSYKNLDIITVSSLSP
jgi:hypothetical protein